jgi:hypothetical protein
MHIEPGHRVTLTLPDTTTRTADIVEADLTVSSAMLVVRPILGDDSALPSPCPADWVTAFLGESPTLYLVELGGDLAADVAVALGSTHDAAYFAAVGRLVSALGAAVAA